MSSGSTPHTVTNGNDRAERSNQQLINFKKMDEELKNLKAYAKRLEEIIEAVNIDVNTRLLVNMLVGEAKQKYNMYNL